MAEAPNLKIDLKPAVNLAVDEIKHIVNAHAVGLEVVGHLLENPFEPVELEELREILRAHRDRKSYAEKRLNLLEAAAAALQAILLLDKLVAEEQQA